MESLELFKKNWVGGFGLKMGIGIGMGYQTLTVDHLMQESRSTQITGHFDK
jgi:hypothetical protein